MRVRPRTDADVEACLAIALEVRERDGYPPHLPTELRRFVASPDAVAAWVAVDGDERVVGHVALHRSSSDEVIELARAATGRDEAGLAVVARLFVAPTARRTGAGTALLRTAAGEAHRLDRDAVLDVGAHFDAAIALYEREGWKRIGDVRVQFRELELHEIVYVLPVSRPLPGPA